MLLLAASQAAAGKPSEKSRHDQKAWVAKGGKAGGYSDMDLMSEEDLKLGKMMLRSIHLADKAVKVRTERENKKKQKKITSIGRTTSYLDAIISIFFFH